MQAPPTSLPVGAALAALLMFPAAMVTAQVVPTTPTKFHIRPIGGGSASAGANISEKKTAAIVQQTIYLTLSELRTWTSTDGKTLNGKLIAWEQTVTRNPTATDVATAPPITAKPTIIKNGSARLLINNKAFEIPLTRLDAPSREFIQQLNTRVAAQP